METNSAVQRLPKWAQEHIATLQRQRDLAVQSLQEWTDTQTVRPFRIMELTCVTTPPLRVDRYIEGRSITAEWAGIRADVSLRSDNTISISFAVASGHHKRGRFVAIAPRAANTVELVLSDAVQP